MTAANRSRTAAGEFMNPDSAVQSDTAIKRQALRSEDNGRLVEYGSIRSNSSNRSKRFERLKRLERFEPRPLPGSPLNRCTVVHLYCGIRDKCSKRKADHDVSLKRNQEFQRARTRNWALQQPVSAKRSQALVAG